MLELKNTFEITSKSLDQQASSSFAPAGVFNFDFLNELEIVSSWDTLTDTATLSFPRKLRFKRDGKVVKNIVSGDDPLFKRGDSVRFVVGYGDQVAERFSGYISNIAPRNPLYFEFQDAMYLLKQETIDSYSKKNITLKTLLSDIMPSSVPFETTVDFTLGYYRIKKATVAEVLEHLRSHYGIVSYIRDGKLFSGLAYTTKDLSKLKIHEINVEQFVIDDSDLVYQRNDDQRIKVRAVSIYPDNTKKEVVVGDSDGGERTQYFYDVPEADLKTYAEEQLDKFKYTGFAGSFLTFVNPIIKHGDAVKLISEKIPDATGVYLVKSVVTTSGMGGGRQKVELDIKI